MSKNFSAAFHGNEWLTHRPTVAQVFDMLDQICELCRHNPVARASLALSPVGTQASRMPYAQSAEENADDLRAALLDLCDDLSGALDAAEADLLEDIFGDAALRWSAFELRLHLKEMRATAAGDAPAASDKILACALRMRDLLRHIDQ